MDRKEMVMRKAEVEYVCDRCGEVQKVRPHAARNTYQLNEAGWRRVETGSYQYNGSTGAVEFGLSTCRDLCRMCYSDFVAFVGMDKPTHAIVQ